jgi:FixJ family two-component response regulator
VLLIVDDDPDVLQALTFMADTRGFEVEHCRTAREAIAAVRPGRLFACMIIDQMLSDDRGIDLLGTLRGRGAKAPAILITSAPSEVLKRRAAAEGAPIVEKPLLDEMLFTQIDRLTRAD